MCLQTVYLVIKITIQCDLNNIYKICGYRNNRYYSCGYTHIFFEETSFNDNK